MNTDSMFIFKFVTCTMRPPFVNAVDSQAAKLQV